MRMILTGVATLAVVGVAVVTMARQPEPRHGEGPNPAVLKQELGLSDEQSTQMQKLWQEERKQAIRRRADTEIARMELEQALEGATVDEKVIAAKVQALTQLEAAAVQARVGQRLALRKLLTPEQRDKMKQLARQHRGREHGREGRFGGGPAGRPPTPNGPAVLEPEER